MGANYIQTTTPTEPGAPCCGYTCWIVSPQNPSVCTPPCCGCRNTTMLDFDVGSGGPNSDSYGVCSKHFKYWVILLERDLSSVISLTDWFPDSTSLCRTWLFLNSVKILVSLHLLFCRCYLCWIGVYACAFLQGHYSEIWIGFFFCFYLFLVICFH